MDELQTVIALVGDVGVWVVFAFWAYKERERANDCQAGRVDDLREFAGLRVQLHPQEPQIDVGQALDLS